VTIYSSIGGMVGLTLALISMIISLVYNFDLKMFGFGIFVFFMIIMQWVQFSSASTSKNKIKEIENDITIQNKLKNLMDVK